MLAKRSAHPENQSRPRFVKCLAYFDLLDAVYDATQYEYSSGDSSWLKVISNRAVVPCAEQFMSLLQGGGNLRLRNTTVRNLWLWL